MALTVRAGLTFIWIAASVTDTDEVSVITAQ